MATPPVAGMPVRSSAKPPRKIPLRQWIAAKRTEGHDAHVIAAMLNQRNIKTSSGMRWSAADVTRYEAARAATSAARTPAPRR